MIKKFSKKAFSLIELSIVILIIGILIAGVTQGSRLIDQMRLATARQVTQSSPIYSIRDLVFWYEVSLQASIDDAEEEDNLPVTNWYDLNPFLTGTKYNLAQSGTARPLYKLNGINGVPALLFDGNNDSMTLTPELTLSTTQTIFVVFKPATAAEDGEILSTTSNNGGRYQIIRYVGTTPSLTSWNGIVYNATITASSAARIVTFTQNAATVQFYDNGTALTSTTVNNEAYKFSQVGALDVTAQVAFAGHIGEIIAYSRVLKTEERKAIESYLGKKYSIKIN